MLHSLSIHDNHSCVLSKVYIWISNNYKLSSFNLQPECTGLACSCCWCQFSILLAVILEPAIIRSLKLKVVRWERHMHATILMEYADMAENIGPQEVQAEKCATGVDVLAILKKSIHFVSIKLANYQVGELDSPYFY